MLERGLHVGIGQFKGSPAGAVLPREHADVCLPVRRSVQTPTNVKRARLQPHGKFRVEGIDFAVFEVRIPVFPFEELSRMHKKYIDR